MARVLLSGTLKQLAGGVSELELEVRDVRQLLRGLGERFPVLPPHLDGGGAIAMCIVVTAASSPSDTSIAVVIVITNSCSV